MASENSQGENKQKLIELSYEEKKRCIIEIVDSMYGKQMKGQKAKDKRGNLVINISNPENKSAIIQVGLFRRLPKDLVEKVCMKGENDMEFRKKLAQFLRDHEGYVKGSHYCYISPTGQHIIKWLLGETRDNYDYDARQMKYLFDPRKIFSQQERDVYIQYIKTTANK